jgi:hypothetical protein
MKSPAIAILEKPMNQLAQSLIGVVSLAQVNG